MILLIIIFIVGNGYCTLLFIDQGYERYPDLFWICFGSLMGCIGFFMSFFLFFFVLDIILAYRGGGVKDFHTTFTDVGLGNLEIKYCYIVLYQTLT